MRAFGAAMLASVTECVEKFQAELAARDLKSLDAVTYLVGELAQPVARLREFFTSAETLLTADDVRVFHFFIQRKIEELRSLAEEIDATYSETV